MSAPEAALADDDHALAARVATAAGKLLVDLRQELVGEGAPRWAIEDEGDRRAHRLIASLLAQARPDDALLSEEGTDSARRLQSPRTWIVDPLDGTREYGEHPRHDWAVHVALVEDHVPTAGAVALPAVSTTYATSPAPVLPPLPDAPPRLVVSRSRPAAVCYRIAEHLGGELLPLGSAGAKAMAVVRGEAEIYAHAGGQYEWDNCAPAAVAAAAGLHVSRIDGSPLRYNRSDPWLPDLLICRREYAASILELVGTLTGTPVVDPDPDPWR